MSTWHDSRIPGEDRAFKDHLTVTSHPDLYSYLLRHSLHETDIQKELRSIIASEPGARYSAPPDEAQFIQLVIEMIGAKNIIEVGVFKGLTTLAMALKLPSDGKIIALDIEKEFSDVGPTHWKKAGVDHLIDLRLAPAVETMRKLLEEEKRGGTFDLIFIDADKDNYPHYYELSLKLLRRGGLILVDNVFFGGSVLDIESGKETARPVQATAIHKINQAILKDDRVSISMIPVADGITICRKK